MTDGGPGCEPVSNDAAESITRRTMFGDFGGDKADYTLGTAYAARRTYLRPKTEDGAHLRPPEGLLTRQQMRAAKLKGGATNKVMKLNEIRKRETEHVPAKRHHSRRTRGRIVEKPKMEFSKYSSLDPLDWVMEVSVGTKMWCNHKTGEVSDICPWEDLNEGLSSLGDDSADDESLIDLGNPHENMKGTGALVYDGKALEEMFGMLDQAVGRNTEENMMA